LIIHLVKENEKMKETSVVAGRMLDFMARASWIRKMFEEGLRLKAEYGAGSVCDLSLGNPDLNPPHDFHVALESMSKDRSPGLHAYMPNAGLLDVRAKVARYAGRVQGVECGPDDVIMTCGAAGGLNIIFKAILDPGDEVITPTPYFVEYFFYADNHHGVLAPVRSKADFSLDLDAIKDAIGPKTRAVLINSPNNPTGAVYSEDEIKALAGILEEAQSRHGRYIFLVSDEPYRRLVFDDTVVPPVLRYCKTGVVVTSFSKDLSIPGERIGYVTVHPEIPGKQALLGALNLANRILGFVNAPALMQRAVAEVLDSTVDMKVYERRRDMLARILSEAGYKFAMPKGAFYFFPRSPIPDDIKFTGLLKDELILAVPGSGFGLPGYFRLAFCVDEEVIKRSRAGFAAAMKKVKSTWGL
jgi:aspartate aminotransferase